MSTDIQGHEALLHHLQIRRHTRSALSVFQFKGGQKPCTPQQNQRQILFVQARLLATLGLIPCIHFSSDQRSFGKSGTALMKLTGDGCSHAISPLVWTDRLSWRERWGDGGGGDNAGCLCFYHKSGDKQKQNKQNVSVAKCRTMERLCLNKVNIHTARSLYTHIFINIHAHKKSTPIQTQHTHTQTCSCTYNYIHPNMSAAPHLQHQGALTARFPASTHHHPPPPPLSPLFPHPSPFPQTHKASPPTQHTHSSLTVSFRNHGTAHSLKGP